jgi:hypothetical protein
MDININITIPSTEKPKRVVLKCLHGNRRVRCRDCGTGFCEHDRRISECTTCRGTEICEHERRRSNCRQCIGVNICEHIQYKRKCNICNLPGYLMHLQRNQIYRALKTLKEGNQTKTRPSIEYLGCTAEYFHDYLKSKMTEGMNFENIQIDHIKPISAFNLANHDDFLDCCHYSNRQPLFASDNQSKSNRWTDIDEVFWLENIKGKEYIQLYIPSRA